MASQWGFDEALAHTVSWYRGHLDGLEAAHVVPVVTTPSGRGRTGMRIVVTGAGGDLGRAVLARMPGHHEVFAFDRDALDVGDHDAVRQVVEPLRTDAILNLAAFTRVDENETDQPRAFRDNALGPQHLALAARATGAVLLHVSTDYVFDGEKGSPTTRRMSPPPLVGVPAKLAASGSCARSPPSRSWCGSATSTAGGNDYLSRTVRRLAAGKRWAASPTVGAHRRSWGISRTASCRWCSPGGSASITSGAPSRPRGTRC